MPAARPGYRLVPVLVIALAQLLARWPRVVKLRIPWLREQAFAAPEHSMASRIRQRSRCRRSLVPGALPRLEQPRVAPHRWWVARANSLRSAQTRWAEANCRIAHGRVQCS